MTTNTKKQPSKLSEDKNIKKSTKRVLINVSIVLALLVVLNLATGIITYGINYARCLKQPITASTFSASYHYFLPGQQGYGPSPFSEYYCTEKEAAAAGFNPGF